MDMIDGSRHAQKICNFWTYRRRNRSPCPRDPEGVYVYSRKVRINKIINSLVPDSPRLGPDISSLSLKSGSKYILSHWLQRAIDFWIIRWRFCHADWKMLTVQQRKEAKNYDTNKLKSVTTYTITLGYIQSFRCFNNSWVLFSSQPLRSPDSLVCLEDCWERVFGKERCLWYSITKTN